VSQPHDEPWDKAVGRAKGCCQATAVLCANTSSKQGRGRLLPSLLVDSVNPKVEYALPIMLQKQHIWPVKIP